MPAKPPVPVLYDGDCGLCTRTARLLRGLDRRHRLELVPFEEARRRGLGSQISKEDFEGSFHVVLPEGVLSGADAIPEVLERLPLGSRPAWWLRRSPFLRRLTRHAYGWVSSNRHRLGGKACNCGAPNSPTPPKRVNEASK